MNYFWVTMALCVLFEIKHYVCDYPLQKFPYMYKNKHLQWHPGGWLHAGVHGLGTLSVFLLLSMFAHVPIMVLVMAPLLDTAIHHSIDHWKMNKCLDNKWGPLDSSEYWLILGQDQMWHKMTYYALIIGFALFSF
jgi:hypothetical protein